MKRVLERTALLMSGLKARNIAYSPFSLKQAMEHTAQYLDDVEVFAQGHGLLQVSWPPFPFNIPFSRFVYSFN